MNTFYRRHLPHWQPGGKVFFVTFRLYGSLPINVIARLKAEAKEIRNQPLQPGDSLDQKRFDDSKRVLAVYEKALDSAASIAGATSPRWLGDAKVAKIVQDAILHRSDKDYRLCRYVIMPNHVHFLIQPLLEKSPGNRTDKAGDGDDLSYRSLTGILRGLKLYSARRANAVLGRTGAFWQSESFDHWVLDEQEHYRIIQYIDRNPVVAGLCSDPADWPWSSAGEK